MTDTPPVKLTAAAVVVCGLVLAGCGSGGDDTAPAAASSSANPSSASPSSKPSVVLTDPGDTQGTAVATSTTFTLTEQCVKLLNPADSTGVPAAVQAQVVVATAAVYVDVVPPLKASSVDTLHTYLADALSVADAQLSAPLSTLFEQVGYVLSAIVQQRALDPAASGAAAVAAVDQIKATCQSVGVTVPAS